MSTKISFNGCLPNAAMKSNAIKLHSRGYVLPKTKIKKDVKSKNHCCHFMVSCDAHKLFSIVASQFFSRSSLPQKTKTKKKKIKQNKINSARVQCTVYIKFHMNFGYHLNDWYIRFLYLIFGILFYFIRFVIVFWGHLHFLHLHCNRLDNKSLVIVTAFKFWLVFVYVSDWNHTQNGMEIQLGFVLLKWSSCGCRFNWLIIIVNNIFVRKSPKLKKKRA